MGFFSTNNKHVGTKSCYSDRDFELFANGKCFVMFLIDVYVTTHIMSHIKCRILVRVHASSRSVLCADGD